MNPTLDYDKTTGRYETRLVNGNPVPTDTPVYQMLTMLFEEPWLEEDTQRRGSLEAEFAFTTTVTQSQLEASLKARMQPLLLDDPPVLTLFEVLRVFVPAPGRLGFEARYQVPGKPPETATFDVGT